MGQLYLSVGEATSAFALLAGTFGVILIGTLPSPASRGASGGVLRGASDWTRDGTTD